MNKILYLISTLFLVILSSDLISQARFTIIDKIYEESDFIVQGEIKTMECSQGEVGISLCLYTIGIDSVFKGNPKIYEVPFGELLKAGQSAASIEEIERDVDVVYFKRDCYYYLKLMPTPLPHINDYCYEVGDTIIVFLKDFQPSHKSEKISKHEMRYYYDIIDQWTGVLPANSYLAIYLRRLSNHNR